MYVLEINTVRPQVTGFGVQEKKLRIVKPHCMRPVEFLQNPCKIRVYLKALLY